MSHTGGNRLFWDWSSSVLIVFEEFIIHVCAQQRKRKKVWGANAVLDNKVHQKYYISRILWYSDWLCNTTSAE